MDITNLQVLENLDFDVFQQMQPLVEREVRRQGAGRNLTDHDIERMVDDVLGNRAFRRQPSIYDDIRLREIARLLILIALYNTYGYNVNPFWHLYFGGIPFFLLPFLNVGRRGISWRPQRPQRPPARPLHRPPPRPPQGGNRPRPPSGGGHTRPPTGGNRPPSPPSGGHMRPPTGGGQTRPPSGGNRPQPPPHGGNRPRQQPSRHR